MSAEFEVIYLATRALVDPARTNTQVTLALEASQNDPPLRTIDGSTQRSRQGLRIATTVHGSWYEGSITVPWITPDQRPYVREFLESTAEQEPFSLHHPDYFGWDSDVSVLRVYRPMNTATLSRLDVTDDYRLQFRWQERA